MVIVKDLIEDWIQMRATLQRQLQMLEGREAGAKAAGADTETTISRIRKCIAELNSLLKEYSRAD